MSEIIRLFDKEFAPKLASRAATFRAVIREASCQSASRIVETGCTRKEDNWAGDGQSTLIWNTFAKHAFKGTFTTIDISQDAIELAQKLCPEAQCICGNSIEVLRNLPQSIDLLYLDSYDLDASTPHNAAMHCFMELAAAMPKLHSRSIVFVDDTPMGNNFKVGGKGLYVGQFMAELGILPFTSGYQAAWLLP